VGQAAIATSDESRGVDIAFGKDTLTLTGQAADVGESRVELPIRYAGTDQVVSLDHRYLSNALKPIDPAAELAIEVRGPKSALLMKTDDGWSYVVMPMTRDR